MRSIDEKGRRQGIYREVNRRVRQVAESYVADQPIDFLCECGEGACTASIELTKAQADPILSQSESAMIATEHAESPNGQRVLAENGRFVVVDLWGETRA
jgi:hypothetical protein